MKFHLVLFFTRGVSLRTWAMVGMLDREIAIYQYFVERGADVSFVTYGDASDLEYAHRLGGIKILCNLLSEPIDLYEKNLISHHGRVLAAADVIKTNQTLGAQTAQRIAAHFHKPFVARCGYMWSANAAREHGNESTQAKEARRIEEEVFSAADAIVVTTPAMKADVSSRIPAVSGIIFVIPNYVDTSLFRPLPIEPIPKSILFVGRIAGEKNIDLLLEAITHLNVRLRIIGEGRLRPALQRQFSHLGDRVIWEGNVANKELPLYINEATIFALPSSYEGHPKALLEAMACESAVIGGNSPGIREIINHGENGLLSELNPFSIREAISHLTDDPQLQERLGIQARRHILHNYSLEKIAEMERELFRRLLTNKNIGKSYEKS